MVTRKDENADLIALQSSQNESLTDEQMFDLRQAFSSADLDGDGFVQTKDIPTIFRNLDEIHKDLYLEDEDLQRCLEQIDVDNAGQISFSQLLMMIAFKINLTDTVEELVEAFRMFDRSNSGYINIDDLWRVMQNLGENPTKYEIEDMMREADKDGDGKINFAEFVEMIRCHEQQQTNKSEQ